MITIDKRENWFRGIISSLCHLTEWAKVGEKCLKYHTVEYYAAVKKNKTALQRLTWEVITEQDVYSTVSEKHVWEMSVYVHQNTC